MNKKKKVGNIMNIAAFCCFLFALVLAVLLRIFALEEFNEWYGKYTDTLLSFETWIQRYGRSWLSVFLILFNYVLKAIIPWFPISCICVAGGVLFEWYYAIAINATGMVILFSLKYFWGKKFGGGNAEKLLSKNEVLHRFIDTHETGSSIVLFALRFIPMAPVNNVSALYGTTDIGYAKFITVSLLGFAYKLFSYTFIGHSFFDPASASFIVPFIMLAVFSGIVLLVLGEGIRLTNHKKK